MKEHMFVLPAPSVATKLTLFLPTGKVLPLGNPDWDSHTAEGLQLSVAFGIE